MSNPNVQSTNNPQVFSGGDFGTVIGKSTTEVVGFYGNTGIAQFSTSGTSSGFTAGGGTTATSTSTFTGGVGTTAYTVSDLVLFLKSRGDIAM